MLTPFPSPPKFEDTPEGWAKASDYYIGRMNAMWNDLFPEGPTNPFKQYQPIPEAMAYFMAYQVRAMELVNGKRA